MAQRAGTPVWRLVAGQLTDTMIMVLLAAAILTTAVGDVTDTAVILAVIVVNTTLGVLQEVRAGRAIAALSTLTAPHARVVRDGAAQLRAGPRGRRPATCCGWRRATSCRRTRGWCSRKGWKRTRPR